jgi:hypothetical protein
MIRTGKPCTASSSALGVTWQQMLTTRLLLTDSSQNSVICWQSLSYGLEECQGQTEAGADGVPPLVARENVLRAGGALT